MRLVKEQCEIEEIDKACNIGYAMHFTAMKMARLGMVEQPDALIPDYPLAARRDPAQPQP